MTEHFIATDNGYNRIQAVGSNPEEAMQTAVEDSGFLSAYPDADPTDAFPILLATDALVEMVNDYGGDISWSIKDGVARTDEEAL